MFVSEERSNLLWEINSSAFVMKMQMLKNCLKSRRLNYVCFIYLSLR